MNTINYNPQVNFGAKFKNPVEILRKDSKGVFKPHKVSFVEIEPQNENDIKALRKASFYWAENDSYACNIYTDSLSLRKNNNLKENFKIFAITEQNDKFDKLEDEKILGLAEIKKQKPREFHISYIQVDPRNVYTLEPSFKKVGTRILDSIKAFADRITLSPDSHGTEKFYERNGFRPFDGHTGMWEWTRE